MERLLTIQEQARLPDVQADAEYTEALELTIVELAQCLDAIQGSVELYDSTLRYAEDPVRFINNECSLFNPDKEPAIMPFHLYDYQAEFIERLHIAYRNDESLLTEKTRQMGMSWLYMAFFLWALLYDPDFSGIVLSYNIRLVDDGGSESSINSLLGKLRFMYDLLRAPLRGVLAVKYLNVRNLRTSAYLVGETAHPNAGRGGSYKIGLWDETALSVKSEEVFSAFYQATRCRCYNSTPRGKGNVFARLRFAAESTVNVVTLHWTLHPEKGAGAVQNKDGRWTSPWYEHECRDMTPAQIAQELDIDYETSVEGRVYEKFRSTVHVLKEAPEFRPEFETIIAWDLGVADDTFGVVFQRDPQGSLLVFDEVVGTDEDIRFYIDLVCGVRPSELDYVFDKKLEAYERFLGNAQEHDYAGFVQVAGPDAGQRSINSKTSVRQQFTTAGQIGRASGSSDRRYRDMRMVAMSGYKILDRIVATRKVMDPARQRFYVSPVCVHTIEHLSNYAWTKTSEGMNREVPDHNWACLRGDVRVRTLNGWVPISEVSAGDFVWGYSEKERRLVPAEVGNAGRTGVNARLLEVGIDSGRSLFCTPEHRLMLRDGSYRRADELAVGDGLMPFYERLNRSYIRVDLNDGTFADEHRFVYSRFNGSLGETGLHVDHINHNRFDNRPENLQLLSVDDHCQKTFRGKSAEERRLVDATPERDFYNSRSGYFKWCKNCGEEFFGTHKRAYCSPRYRDEYRKMRDRAQLIPSRSDEARLEKNRKAGEKYRRNGKNHKVRFIRSAASADVYDLSVPELGNFVAEGVVVHNSHGADAVGYGVLYFSRRREVRMKPDLHGDRVRRTTRNLGTPMRVGR